MLQCVWPLRFWGQARSRRTPAPAAAQAAGRRLLKPRKPKKKGIQKFATGWSNARIRYCIKSTRCWRLVSCKEETRVRRGKREYRMVRTAKYVC